MPKIYEWKGKHYEMPDSVSDEDALDYLAKVDAPPLWGDVIASVPGEANRKVVSTVAGLTSALGDITGSSTLQDVGRTVRRGVQAEREAEMPQNLTIPQEMVASGLTSAAVNVPLALATGLGVAAAPAAAVAAAGGPLAMSLAAGTTGMGAMTALDRYGEVRDAGFSPLRAGFHGLAEGLVEKYTEYMPAKELLVGNKLLKEMGRYFQKEMLGEQTATLLQDLSAKLSDRPDMTLGDYFHDALITAGSTPIGGAAQYAAFKGVGALLPTPDGSGITPDNSGGQPPIPPTTAPPPVTVPAVPAAPLSPPVQPAAVAPPATAAPARQSINDLLGTAIPAATPPAPEPPRVVGTLRVDDGYDGYEMTYLLNPDGTFERRAKTDDGIETVTRMVTAGDGTTVWALVSDGKTARPPAVVLAPDADSTFRAELAEAKQMSAGTDQTVTLPTAAKRTRKSPSTTQGAADGQAEETGQAAEAEVLGETAEGVVSASTIPPVVTKMYGDREVSNVYSTFRGQGKVEIRMPDTEHARLRHLGRLLNDRRNAKTDKRRAKLSLEIDSLRLEVANHFGFAVGEVDGIAESYAQKVAEKLNARAKAVGTVSEELNLTIGNNPVSVPELPVRVESPYATQPGKVTIEPRFADDPYAQRSAKYLEGWMRVFSPNMRIVILEVMPQAGPNQPPKAGATFYENGVHYVRLGSLNPAIKSKAVMVVLDLAHEFGHMLVQEHLHQPRFAAVLKQLRADHAALVARIPNMTVEEFLNEWSNPGHSVAMKEFEALMGVARTAPATQLVDSVNQRMGSPDYFLSFDEYIAEQFARYVNSHQKISFGVETQSFWQEAKAAVKEFYDKIVQKLAPSRTFTRFADDLRGLAKNLEAAREAGPTTATQEYAAVDMALQEVNRGYTYTLKVLKRLPEKEFVKKATVLAELKRADVTGQERELLEDVLHDMPDTIDRSLLEYKTLLGVTELRLQTLFRTRYNTFGWDRLKFSGTPTSHQPEITGAWTPANGRRQAILMGRPWMETHIWQVPFSTGPNRHFKEARNYWAHTRVLLEDGGRTIGEVQSDIEQSGETDETLASTLRTLRYIADRIENINTFEDYLDVYSSLRATPYAPFELLPQYTSREDFFDHWGLHGKSMSVTAVQSRIETITDKQDGRIDLSNANMPKHWFRVVLRSESVEAAKNGESWVRIPDLETLVRFEGWSMRPKYGSHHSKTLAGLTLGGPPFSGNIDVDDLGSVLLGVGTGSEGYYINMDELSGVFTDEQLASISADITMEFDNPAHQAIYDKYRRDIIPFVNKEFKAKHTIDQFGQGWWQWDVNPELAEQPIEYFQADMANGAAVNALSSAANLPSIPRAFEHIQGLMTSVLQLNQMAKMLPNVEGLQKYRLLMQDMHNLKNSLMEQPNNQIQRWHNMNVKQAELTEDALRAEEKSGAHWTTLVQDTLVDSMGNSRQVWVHQPNPEFLATMQSRGIRAEGVTLFLAVKNDFLRVLQTMEETLLKSVAAFYEGNYIIQQAKLASVREEFARLRQIPYLPDTRFGNYAVRVLAGHDETVNGRKIKKGEIVYYAKFESQRDQKKHFDELSRAYAPMHKVTMAYEDDTISSLQSMPKSFVDTVIAVMDSNPDTALTQEQRDLLIETQYDFTATGAFEAYLKKGRKGVGGAEKDLRRVYANYMWRTANHIAKLSYGKPLQGAIGDVQMEAQQTRNEAGDSIALDKLAAYLRRNYKYVMTPQNEWQGLRAFVSLWYLIGSPKTALMNFMSVPVLTYSYLGARYGDATAVGTIAKAIKTVAQFWKDPQKVSAINRQILQQAKADGVTDQSFAAMLANVAEGGVALEKLLPKYGFLKSRTASDSARKITWKITSMGMAPFRVVEQINRMVTLIAAYELEAKKLGATNFSKDAYMAARAAVDYTQNEFAPWNRPEFMRGKKGIFLLFYSFVQNMSFMLFGGDKGWWRAMLVLLAMAGLQGLPGMDNILDVLNWSARKLTGQNVDLRTEAREVAEHIGMNPDLVMHGFSHSTFGLGWDVSNSAGIGRIIPGTDAIFGVGKFEHRFLQAAGEVGGPAASLALSFLQALADDNPNALLRFDRTLPPALRNVERAAMAMEQSAWVDGRGNPLVLDPTALEVIGQAMGFSPTRKTEVQERLRVERDAVQFYTLSRQMLLGAMYSAKKSGEFDAWLEAKEAVTKFNDRVPYPELKITSKDIAQSAKNRGRAEVEAVNNDSPQKRYQRLYDTIGPLYSL